MGRGRAGRVGDKNIKPIPAPPRGAGTKYCPIPAPPPLRVGENPHGAGRGKIAIPSENHCHRLNNTTLQNSFPSCIKASFIEQFVYTKNNSPAR